MKRILLVDADSKEGFANLALMKISAWHKKQGNEVFLQKGLSYPLEPFDHIYVSCIFFQNAESAHNLIKSLDNVSYGGSGFLNDSDPPPDLKEEIEHILPDYDLYNTESSMGFTSRGCIRKCKWCVVLEKEGSIRDNAPISEFLDPRHDKVILLDNNFQASPRWRENLDFIKDRDLKVNFNQGLDIRLVDREFAEALASVKYYDWRFKSRRLHFAFDDLRYEKKLDKGIKILNDAGIQNHRLMFYILVGFNSTFEEDLYRTNKIMDLGALPYIMIYNKRKDPDLNDLARWINRGLYRFVPWKKYTRHFKKQPLKPAKSVEWGTPQALFDELDAEFDFSLDVAASDQNKKCAKYFTIEDNGLEQDWSKDTCYMNPPYGNDLREWTKKALEESENGAVVVGLLPVRSDTRWFHDYVLHKAEVRFIKGRVKYDTGEDEPMPATFPSMVVIWRKKGAADEAA